MFLQTYSDLNIMLNKIDDVKQIMNKKYLYTNDKVRQNVYVPLST